MAYRKLDSMIEFWKEEEKELGDSPTMKDIVSVYRSGQRLIRKMNDELDVLRDGIVPATARYSTDVVAHTGVPGDPTCALVVRIESLSEQVKDVENHCNRLEANIRWGLIYQVDNQQEREICFMRYIQNLPYTDIAKEAGYSEGYCRSVVSKVGKMEVCPD